MSGQAEKLWSCFGKLPGIRRGSGFDFVALHVDSRDVSYEEVGGYSRPNLTSGLAKEKR